MSVNIPIWIKEPISVFVKSLRHQPFNIALSHARCNFAENRHYPEEKISGAYSRYNRQISEYLSKRYAREIISRKSNYDKGIPAADAPVWVFWWQGEKNAPELVKICLASVRRHAGSRPVIMVDSENYKDYVQLPVYIEEKRASGVISLTHFSDILRINLLARYGGLWMDATIFCTGEIGGDWFSRPICTCRNPGGDDRNTSRWNWTGYCIGGWKQNVLFCLVRDIFELYWQEHETLLEYFLIDHVIRLVWDHCPEVRAMIGQIPPNNTNIYRLHSEFSLAGTNLDFLRDETTWMYKLSWKAPYKQTTNDGKPTCYAVWLEQNRLNTEEQQM